MYDMDVCYRCYPLKKLQLQTILGSSAEKYNADTKYTKNI